MNIRTNVIRIIENGGIGVIPTDTVYGLVGSASSKKAVRRIYGVRKRQKNKPLIILVGSLGDLKKFGTKVSGKHLKILEALWPGPVSVILPVKNRKFSYLHRGTNAIAFRLPADKRLRNLLKKTGPLVAPSANLAGQPPAKTIAEARRYFGARVDFYIGGGKCAGIPSTLVEIKR